MRPASAGCALGHNRRSRLQVKVGNRGLCRRTEPQNADIQMQGFLDHGTVPVLSFKASREKVQASLSRPLHAVRTELMGIATAILNRVVGGWGCVEELVEQTRGKKIDRLQAEEFIDKYLQHHNVPGKLQVRWVKKLNSGGKLQEYGRRDEPTGRRLRLWISSGFSGASYSRSMIAFADHEICTHAVRAINEHTQVCTVDFCRYLREYIYGVYEDQDNTRSSSDTSRSSRSGILYTTASAYNFPYRRRGLNLLNV